MKGDTVPLLELHVDGKTFILTNVTCIRGLEQGLVRIEGDVDKVTVETVELVQFKEDQAEIEFVKVDEDVHPRFKLNGVQTGRMPASEPNIANIPRAEPTDDDTNT